MFSTNTIPQLAEGIMADLWKDFWTRETGTGQQVAQLHDRYMMMMMMMFSSGYNTYRGWTQTGYLNKHYNINQKDEDT